MSPDHVLRAGDWTCDYSIQELVPEVDSNISFCSGIIPLVHLKKVQEAGDVTRGDS
jgi:hypothetical protein